MKITKIKCHQSVTLNRKENLGFSAGVTPQYPHGLTIEYIPELQAFRVKHDGESVFVSKENVPYFEGELDSDAVPRKVQRSANS